MNGNEQNRMLNTVCELWTELNPHGQVHGCWQKANGDVCLYIWYRFTDSEDGNNRIAPIEICIGNDVQTVVDTLKLACAARTVHDKQCSQPKTAI